MGFLVKIKNGFVSTKDFFRDGYRELKKVRWPNRKELVSYSTIVVFTVAFVTIFFFVVDLGISSLLQLLGIGK